MSEALRFLTALCSRLLPDEVLEIRTFYRGGERDGQRGPRRFGTDPSALAEFVAGLPGGLDVFYGINPRRRATGGTQRGRKEDVTRVLWIQQDVDYKHFAGAAEAVAMLNSFPLPPTLVIATGGGLQALWRLAEPLLLSGLDDPQIAEVEGITARMAAAMGGLDPTIDIARVYRVPGSRNFKYPETPGVVLRHEDWDAAYSLEEFAALLPAPEVRPRPARAALPHDDATADELREMLRHIDPQPGYADWVRVLAGIHSAFPGPEGIAIAEEWSPGDARNPVEEKFKSFGHFRGPRGPITLGTIVYLAKRGGWRPPERTFALSGRPETPASATRSADAPLDPALAEYLAMPHEELARRAYRAERFNRGYLRFDKNKGVKTQKPTIRAVLLEYENKARAGHLDADGWAASSLAALAELGGASKDSAGDHLRDIAHWDVGIEKDVRDEDYRVPVANGGEIIQKRPRLYIKVNGDVVDKLEELAVFTPPRAEGKTTWGGTRDSCGSCGSHNTHRETRVVCADCGHIGQPIIETPKAIAPPGTHPITPADLQDVLQTDEPDPGVASVPPTPVAVPPAPQTTATGAPVYVREEASEEQDDWDPSECNAVGCRARIDPGLGHRFCWQHRHLRLDPPAAPVRPPAPLVSTLDADLIADLARRNPMETINERITGIKARWVDGGDVDKERAALADWLAVGRARVALDVPTDPPIGAS